MRALRRTPSGARIPAPPRGERRGGGVLRMALLLALLLAALASVVSRQTRGVALQREIRSLEGERAVAEAARLELETRIQSLQSRSRVVRVARDRLGMHLPADSEVVLVPLPRETVPAAEESP
ncbi:MAG TPA: cell division protein FtsL [Longimicrobiaceae bacterium]|nr:cell division protein FtsL [Longimicrobiaceae bacterium]